MGRGGGRAATCCVQLCSKVSPTSAEKLSRETMSTLRSGRALRTAPSPSATASASLLVSALQMLMSFLSQMLLCQPKLSMSPGLLLWHLPPPSPVCHLRDKGLRRLKTCWCSGWATCCVPLACKGILSLCCGPGSFAHSEGQKRHHCSGGGWILAISPRPSCLFGLSPASAGPQPLLPRGGLGQSPLSPLAAVANDWDNVCRVTGTHSSLCWQLQPRDPEIRGCSHV